MEQSYFKTFFIKKWSKSTYLYTDMIPKIVMFKNQNEIKFILNKKKTHSIS